MSCTILYCMTIWPAHLTCVLLLEAVREMVNVLEGCFGQRLVPAMPRPQPLQPRRAFSY